LLSENDSFVEMLHTVRPQDEKTIMSQSVFKTSPVQNVPDVINESKQCPVCLQIIDLKNFINHVKSCGTSHKLSSEVLIKAVDLQERQTAEREALGLPKLTKTRDVKVKKKCTKQTKSKALFICIYNHHISKIIVKLLYLHYRLEMILILIWLLLCLCLYKSPKKLTL